MSLNVQDAEFLTSAVKPDQYPQHHYKELALVGRSNVGKSSLINALVNRRRLARTSGTPGRTQTINFYRVDNLCIVDLPGYGFAKVSAEMRRQWKPMIENYFLQRPNLGLVFQLVDIRHKPTQDDEMMAAWLRELGIPAYVVATKADKISRGRHKPSAQAIAQLLQLPTIVFSAETRQGKPELLAMLNELVRK